MCMAIEAAEETAHSKEEAGPSPRCAIARVSSRIVARLCHTCSSRRTISSPVRAVERQCTRRRSSPWRYSRVPMSSSPAAATEVAWPSPRPLQACPTGAFGSAWTCGVTVSACCAENERDSSTSPNGSASRSASGPSR